MYADFCLQLYLIVFLTQNTTFFHFIQDEEDIVVGQTTTVAPLKTKRKRTNKFKMVENGMPICKMRIAETLPASVFSEKDLAKDHLPMHEVRTMHS